MMKRRYFAALLFAATLPFGAVDSPAQTKDGSESFMMPATFGLGDRLLVTKSCFVVLTDEYFSGKTRALKLLFTTKPITETAKEDILKNDGRSFTSGTEHAYLVLFLDEANRIWQINATIILKGKTVGYTVAYKPEDLKKFASQFVFDGQRLRFRSQGEYTDTDSDKTNMISWDVSSDLPVYNIVGSRKK